MKFFIKSPLFDSIPDPSTSGTDSPPSQEQSSMRSLSNFSVVKLISQLTCDLNSLDSQFENYQIDISMEVITGCFIIRLVHPEAKSIDKGYIKYSPIANKSIKVYENKQLRAMEAFRRTQTKLKEAKKFMRQYLAKIREMNVLTMICNSIDSMIECPKELTIKDRSLSEDTNATIEQYEGSIERFTKIFDGKGKVFYPSCLFQVD